MRIFYLIGVPLATYILDWLYGLLFASYHLPILQLVRNGKCVEITWKHPVGYVDNGSGYVYICLPWISKYEWHVFSVYAHPTKPNHSSICMMCIGDWTKTLHSMLTQPLSRPGWIYGPFPSEFSDANKFDNLAVCATGIGITPVISLLVSLKKSRKVNVIWMVRDHELIEFFLRYRCFSDNAFTLIFYTGDIKLLRITDLSLVTPWIKIIRGRPNLKSVIKSIICAKVPKELFFKTALGCYLKDVGCYLKSYDAQEIFLQAVALSTKCLKENLKAARKQREVNVGLKFGRKFRYKFLKRKNAGTLQRVENVNGSGGGSSGDSGGSSGSGDSSGTGESGGNAPSSPTTIFDHHFHIDKQIIQQRNTRRQSAVQCSITGCSITGDGECSKYNEEDSQVHSPKTSSLKPHRVNSSVSKEGMQKLLVENICKSEQSKQVAREAIRLAFDDSTLVLTSTMNFTQFYTILVKLETIVESSNEVIRRINSIKKIPEMWTGAAATKVNVLARANSASTSPFRTNGVQSLPHSNASSRVSSPFAKSKWKLAVTKVKASNRFQSKTYGVSYVENKNKSLKINKNDMDTMRAWGVFFCGGSKPVIRVLKELHEETGISLMIESFKY